jgi:hypothetical protein
MQHNLSKKHVGKKKEKREFIPTKFKFTGRSARDVHAPLIFFQLVACTWDMVLS